MTLSNSPVSAAVRFSLECLEWPAVRAILAGLAQSAPAAERLSALEPVLDRAEVERVYSLVTAAAEMERLSAWPGLADLVDPEPVLARAERGSVLEGLELRDLSSLVSAARSFHRVLEHYSVDRPALAPWLKRLDPLDSLYDALETAVERDGSLKSTASAELGRLREEVDRRSQGIRSRLQEILKSEKFQPFLQDDFYTIRENRFVVPLKAGAQAQIQGIVHDNSSTGATVFIEPQEMIEANNKLKTAFADLAREELRIRRELTDMAAAEAGRIRSNAAVLIEIDTVLARVRFAAKTGGSVPGLTPPGDFRYRLRGLCHPLLRAQGAACVPNDIEIGGGCASVIVSGPNTGGKTVLLKAVGLAAVLAKAAVPVTASAGSLLPLVPDVFADIGDNQTLTGALSTFSGHLFQLRRILEEARPGSLAVLDELMNGTDPSEGAALGRAVLEEFASKGILAVVSTHYEELKLLPSDGGRRLIAGMEFDPVTLKPTFRMRTGTPGHSRAIEAAGRQGFPAGVVERARALVSEAGREVARLIEELEHRNQTLELERNSLIDERKDLEKTERELRAEIEKLKTQEGKRLSSEAARLRDEVSELRGLVKLLRRQAEDEKKVTPEMAKRVDSAVHRAQAAAAKADTLERNRDREPDLDPSRAVPGTAVRLRGSDTIGKVDSPPDAKGRIWIEFMGQRTQTTLDRLVPAKSPPASKDRKSYIPLGAKMESRLDSLELDLHGMREEDALKEVEKFLDTAMAQNADRVRIIHGMGSGRLQKAVRAYLSKSPYVARFETAVPQAGGHGVTEVLLRG